MAVSYRTPRAVTSRERSAARASAAAGQRQLDVVPALPAGDGQHDAVVAPRVVEATTEGVEGVERLAVEAEEDVAALDADALRGASRPHACHDERLATVANLQPEQLPRELVRVRRRRLL